MSRKTLIFFVHSDPGVDTRGVSAEQVLAIGGVPRYLAEILTAVADGRSELIYVG